MFMKTLYTCFFLGTLFLLASCSTSRKTASVQQNSSVKGLRSTVHIRKKVPIYPINTGNVNPEAVVSFAKTLEGVPYKYGSMDKRKGFDCSGFIDYVFNHFRIAVPRVSSYFTNSGEEVPIDDSRPGDLILFTGSNAHSGVVGHMGIVTENDHGMLKFIHASSSRGVMVSGMNSYFIPRFVKVNRIFPDPEERVHAKKRRRR